MKCSSSLGALFAALLCSLSFLASSCSSTQTAADGHVPVFSLQETPIHIYANIDYITTWRGRSAPVLGDRYFVELLGDSAYVYIPFFGRMYTAAPSYDGTNFDEPYYDLKVTRNKKNTRSTLSFKCKHESFVYNFQLDLYDGNSMRLLVTPNVGQSCSYNGKWKEVELKDKNGNVLPPRY